jgi:hypothetical protein
MGALYLESNRLVFLKKKIVSIFRFVRYQSYYLIFFFLLSGVGGSLKIFQNPRPE